MTTRRWGTHLVGLLAGLVIGVTAVVATRAHQLVLIALVALAALAGLAVFVGVERVLFAVALLNAPLQTDLYLGYRDEIGELGGIGGLPLSVGTAAIALLLARSVLLWALRPPRARTAPPPTTRWFLAFVALTVVASLVSLDRELSLFGTAVLLQAFVLYMLLVKFLTSAPNMRFVVVVLLLGLLVEAGLVLADRGLGVRRPERFSVTTATFEGAEGVLERATGSFGSPNAAAGYFSVMALLALAGLVVQQALVPRWLAMMAATLGGAALALTQSRGGLLAFALGLLVLFVVSLRRTVAKLSELTTAFIVVATLALVFANQVLTRFVTDDRGAAASRFPLNELALRLSAEHPLFGAGPNTFAAALPSLATPEYADTWLYVVHNQYLLVAAEAGLPALAMFIGLLIAAVVAALRATDASNAMAGIAVGVVAALLARSVHQGFDIFNTPVQWEVLATLCALAVGASNFRGEPGLRSGRGSYDAAEHERSLLGVRR